MGWIRCCGGANLPSINYIIEGGVLKNGVTFSPALTQETGSLYYANPYTTSTSTVIDCRGYSTIYFDFSGGGQGWAYVNVTGKTKQGTLNGTRKTVLFDITNDNIINLTFEVNALDTWGRLYNIYMVK